jgi:signal transduction histidine kinase
MKLPRLSLKSKIIFFMFEMVLASTIFFFYIIYRFGIGMLTAESVIRSPYLLLALIIVIMVIYFMMLISLGTKYIFVPIGEMKRAASHIKAGNLNYPLTYQPDNEIGEFCEEFDKMRVRLRDTIMEQHELEKGRKRLIASITHDLRTPLTSIIGYVEALQDGIAKDQDTYEQYLGTIHEKAELLNHLIDDLSVYTRQELGEFTLNLERIHSGRLLNHYFEHKTYEFKFSNIKLILKKPFIATYINVDPYRFTQVLDNLISNAKKYTKTQIVVETTVRNYHLYITVSDDGAGIPQDYLQNLFDPFFMVNKKKDQREKGGSGLGLAIVKQLIEAHEGGIEVVSALDQGTSFTINIPIDR